MENFFYLEEGESLNDDSEESKSVDKRPIDSGSAVLKQSHIDQRFVFLDNKFGVFQFLN